MSIEHPVKRLLLTLTQGVYVVGVSGDGANNAFTAAAVMPVSFNPPMLAVAVNPANASYPLLVAGGIFAVTVLRSDQRQVADFFGTRSAHDGDKLREVPWHASPAGAPVLNAGLAWFDCSVTSKHPAGDHVVILAEMTAGDFLQPGGRPLRYDELGDLDGSVAMLPPRLGGATPAP